MPLPMNVELLDKIYNNPWINPHEQQLLILRYKEGLLNFQIAQSLHCSKETVGRDFKRLFKKIEPLIIEYYEAQL